MKRLGILSLTLSLFASSALALEETAARANLGPRKPGTTIPVMMAVFEVSPGVYETRQVRVNNAGEMIVDASSGPVTLGGGSVTVIQGGSGTTTVPWFISVSRRSDGLEFGLPATPFVVGGDTGAGARAISVDNLGYVSTNLNFAGFPARTGAGTSDPTTQRVVLATDQGPVTTHVAVSVLPAGASTEATLAAVLAKLLAAPATEAKQDTGNTNTQRTDEGVTNVIASVDSVDAAVTFLINQGAVASVAGISDGAGNILPIQRAIIEQTTTDPVTIKTAVGGKRLVVTNVSVIGDGNVNVTFRSNAAATTGDIPITKNSGFAPGFDPTGTIQAEVGEALVLQTSSAVHVAGWINWVEAP